MRMQAVCSQHESGMQSACKRYAVSMPLTRSPHVMNVHHTTATSSTNDQRCRKQTSDGTCGHCTNIATTAAAPDVSPANWMCAQTSVRSSGAKSELPTSNEPSACTCTTRSHNNIKSAHSRVSVTPSTASVIYIYHTQQ